MSEKLRKEILETKKQSLEYTKLLKDDALKRGNAEKEQCGYQMASLKTQKGRSEENSNRG